MLNTTGNPAQFIPFPLIFQSIASKLAAKTALNFEGQLLSYSKLNKRSNQLAHYLSGKGIRAGNKVAIALDRSPKLIISLLAVLKTGAAYIPVDPHYPIKRIELVLNDSGSDLIITSENLLDEFSNFGTALFNIDSSIWTLESTENLDLFISETDLAYLIYTSGSSGEPKGIAIPHRGLTNFLLSFQKAPGITENDKLLATSTISFDMSVLELFLPLSIGAEVVLATSEITRDSKKAVEIIRNQRITHMQATPSAWRMMLETGWTERFNLKIMSGGEALEKDLAEKLLLRCTELWNLYGPTETSVYSAVKKIELPLEEVSAGPPIDNTIIYILNEEQEILPDGKEGEICIGGLGLAREYHNKPELTAGKFIFGPKGNANPIRLFRTGDLGIIKNGEIYCYGRIDDQLKLRGHRVEPGAIETLLNSIPGIKSSKVIAYGESAINIRLIAYIVSEVSYAAAEAFPLQLSKTWKAALSEFLPDYMIPSEFIPMDHIPLLPNGKTDRKSLPKPRNRRREQTHPYKAPESELEKQVAEIWKSLLYLDKVGVRDNFFELGGNSILAVRFMALLEKEYAVSASVTRLYQYPSIETFVRSLESSDPINLDKSIRAARSEEIAVIGMAGRFPGANTVAELWEILRQGKETTRFFSDDELDPSISAELRNDANYVKARGVIDNAENFDAEFFNIPQRLASIMDPQQRVLLEIAWEILESAGHIPGKYDGKIGVFAGSGSNSYYLNNIHPRPEIVAENGYFQISTLNDKDYIAMRLAYELNLKGPAVSVYSSSSTSLLAIAQAVESLRQGNCDAALAGGIAINSPINSGHIYQEGTMFSADGHCRPFDAEATGTVFSDGGGLVLLKPLSEAINHGDKVLAVIRGVGVSNDGAFKASFTAPHVEGQARAIAMAFQDAKTDPSEISFIEAHGTATPIGDPIELEALKLVFGKTEKAQYCAIGSLKSNMGHLTHAAGVAGFIKTVLALQHKQIPPSLFFKAPNPLFDFENSPFYVNTKLQTWESDKPLKAGVSSFGMGGTNIHVVLEEADVITMNESLSVDLQLIRWSAKSEESLIKYADKLKSYLAENPETSLTDLAFTLKEYRVTYKYRTFLLASSVQELIAQIEKEDYLKNIKIVENDVQDVVFIFPGQGSQYPGMGSELYDLEPVFKDAVDDCANILTPLLQTDIRLELFNTDQETSRLNNTRYTQPALFVIEYALAKLWMGRGVQPSALAGHSIGEFVAAHLAGIFSLEDVLNVVSKRALLISQLAEGRMLALRMPAEKLRGILSPGLSIAAFNAPELTVVSGPAEEISTFQQHLKSENIPGIVLKTSHAFHSSMMDEIIDPFSKFMETIPLHKPQIPIVSSVTGDWLSPEDAMNPEYWVSQIRKPVLFSEALNTLQNHKPGFILEIGPGNALSTFVRQHRKSIAEHVESGIWDGFEKQYVANSNGKLDQAGVSISLKQIGRGKLITIPTYAFNRSRYWIDPLIPTENQSQSASKILLDEPKADGQKLIQTYSVESIRERINRVIEKASGIDVKGINANLSFIEIGLDSLLLTQLAINLKKEFNIPISFRQLSEELATLHLLCEHVSNLVPAISVSEQDTEKTISAKVVSNSIQQTFSANPLAGMDLSISEQQELSKPFGASPRIEKKSKELSAKQTQYLRDFTAKYNQKTRLSKEYTQKHRKHMADPRVVSGFRPLTKELVYPIVARRSKGCHIWDLDGNEYVDALNGFGSSMLGYQPDLIANAIKEQMDKGYEIGPQHELAGDVCELICEFTGFDRAAICSTGSEAVMGTMRIARTVTGRSLIVAFSGSYHGIFDEVIVRGTRIFRSIPAAPGIMPEAVQNMLILDYGTDESLRIIAERGHEIAAVLVEPVQSRRPEFQPIEFLKKLRTITEQTSSVLIFDEVITGFRMHPGGAQAMFDVKADLASYGKVIGGGLPIGVIAGRSAFMDALDGGNWQFGDSSIPEAGVTYFAGTFVRHPLALIAAKTSLEYFRKKGPALQQELNLKTKGLMDKLNAICMQLGVPMHIVGFGSMWKIKFNEELPFSELLFNLMRFKGIHILDSFPCFMTEAHSLSDLEQIANSFKESVAELFESDFFGGNKDKPRNFIKIEERNIPPVSGARLGRDREGNPAWFVSDPDNPGKYLQVNTLSN